MNDEKDSLTITGTGKVFAEGREALNLTREQTADVLNLSVRVVRAIEESKPEQLPDRVYVNGYIRSYAKLLGLASQPLIDAWWAQHAEQPADPATAGMISDRASGDESGRPLKIGRWAALALVLSGGFVYFVTNNNQGNIHPEAPATGQQVQTKAVDEQPDVLIGQREATAEYTEDEDSAVEETVDGPKAIEANTDVDEVGAAGLALTRAAGGEVQSEQGSSASQLDVDIAFDEIQSTTQTTENIAESGLIIEEQGLAVGGEEAAEFSSSVQEAVTEREIARAFALPRLTEQGDEEIQLDFTSDCWFEIRDEAGVLLYADLGRSGQARRYIGKGPFRIKLGYSPGVLLVFNDSEINLQPFTRKGVAVLVVGADNSSTRASNSGPST